MLSESRSSAQLACDTLAVRTELLLTTATTTTTTTTQSKNTTTTTNSSDNNKSTPHAIAGHKNNVRTDLEQSSAGVDGALEDGLVDDLRQRREEVRRHDLRRKEHLRSQEPLVAHVRLIVRAVFLRSAQPRENNVGYQHTHQHTQLCFKFKRQRVPWSSRVSCPYASPVEQPDSVRLLIYDGHTISFYMPLLAASHCFSSFRPSLGLHRLAILSPPSVPILRRRLSPVSRCTCGRIFSGRCRIWSTPLPGRGRSSSAAP